ncbi:ABC transporter periplasmic component [Corynebacterium deserti GIMN1.010]|uniref:ABC transporter periplasmic component n=1 Tax=Corynebacterium deserti GIMN1.010 TaxID=931089 RepID=A0A0M3Q9X0_9CORY|nr:ABC transporter substrate-binding protein [Corynebacterium deserti]ALC06479.1 ABC transporter periplasmic component [Corynebacterium deserti GIMN1.010]
MKILRNPLTSLLLASTFVISACSAGSTSYQEPVEVDQSSIVVATTAAPASLDFTNASGAAIPQAMMSNVYEGLVRIDSEGEIQPMLATSWEVSEDRQEYVFQLREGVTFSNGEPFDAESAKFSIDRVKTDWTNGLKSGMDVVESTEVVDTHVLRVRLTRPSNQWLWNMGTAIGAMMTEGGVDKLATDPVGTGPYTVTHWAPGRAVGFTAREDYWGEAPANDAATIRYFSDATATTNALQSGDVDVIWAMQAPEQLSILDDFAVEVGTTNGEMLLSMNNQRAPFDDVRVRQAVMYAVDRQAIIDTALEGYGTDTGGVPVPPTDPWYEKSDQYPFDPDRARELLREAGYSESERVRVTMSIPSLPYAQAASEILYSQLRDVGFDPVIESTEFPAVWLSQVMGHKDYDMSLIAHVEPRDLPTLFSPGYYLGFADPETQELLVAADSSETEVEMMKDVVDRIMDQAGADNLMNVANIVVMDKTITGVDPNVVSGALELSVIGRR